jgi:hypothetical protein
MTLDHFVMVRIHARQFSQNKQLVQKLISNLNSRLDTFSELLLSIQKKSSRSGSQTNCLRM